MAPATNVNSEPFPWLVLNRSRGTCPGLQCIRMVVCKTAFFIRVPLFSNTGYRNLAKCFSRKLLTLIIFIIIVIVHLLTVEKKWFHII